MFNARNATFDYSESKTAMSLGRYNVANFRIPFRISRLVILTVMASILLCHFTEFVTGRQASTPHRKKLCLKNLRRSMPSGAEMIAQNVTDAAALTPQDIISRLETAAVLRDNLVTALGHVLLLCLDDDARVPFERVHDAVRIRRVAAYELLQILPMLRGKTPKRQLYKLVQMLERVDNRFISEYASLCIDVFPDLNADLEEASLGDMLRNIDRDVIESISRDKHRIGAMPLTLANSVDFVLRAAHDDNRILNLHTVSAILLNHPEIDQTDPEVPSAMRFLAQQMKERSRADDPLLQYADAESAASLLKTVLDRLEVDLQSSDLVRDAASLLLQYLGAESYPRTPSWKSDPKKLLTLSDRYPVSVTVVAKYLADRLDESHFQDLDIGFYETDGDYALLQTLSRLRRKPDLQHLRKTLSLLIPFVSQMLMSEADHDHSVPISFFEVNEYLDSFDTPCLQQNISDAMKMLRPHLTENLPWTYVFGNRRMSDDPWELTLNALIHLRNIPISKLQATAIDNFVYKSRINRLTGERDPLYESGIIFQRDDSTDVELDFFSLLLRIPNIFKSEKFAPMLNFFSKSNVLDVLGYEFNKFEHDTSRDLLLALLKQALTLPLVKFDKSLSKTLQNARNYLQEPLLINLYTLEDLQRLLKNLPGIDSDPRYLPLKFLFRKQKLFAYLSPTFSLAGLHTPTEQLSLILKTVSLKVTQPKLVEALSFALENIDGLPLPVKPMERDDFVYLTQQLLSRNKTLEQLLLQTYAYINYPFRDSWNISIRGTPEIVLARFLNYPTFFLKNDTELADLVERATSILEGEDLIDIEILKKHTLEAMLEHLPSSTYVKPVSLLLRKANLMTLVPKLNLTMLENVDAHDALIALLQNLTESRMIRAQRTLLRRVRTALSLLDSVSAASQSPIFVYLTQSLQDPSNAMYKPLLQEITSLQNVTVLPEERQTWLQHHLQQIIARNESEELTRAASTALQEIAGGDILDEESRAGKERISEATSLLPDEFFAESLKKLLTPDWTYNVLPDELRKTDILEKKELLLAILHYAKQRTDIADNPALMRAIFRVETNLIKWQTNVEQLRSIVTTLKAAVYDSMKTLLTASALNTLKIAVPADRKSAKTSLLALLQRLLTHPMIKENRKIFNLVSVVKQDVVSFSINVDLLSVLDDMGIPYIDELAPVRLFLHKEEISLKFGPAVLKIADPEERYRALLNVLEQQQQANNDTQLFNALSTLQDIQPKKEATGTLISDLDDIVNTIPHRIREDFGSIDHLFDANILSHLTRNNDIVLSNDPLDTLLSKIADLPEVSDDHVAVSELNKMRSELKKSDSHQIVTGFQIRPLLLELRHVQQVNVDYLSFILDPEMLSYLNSDEFADIPNDNVEMLRTVVDYLLHEGPGYADHNMQKNLQSIEHAMTLMTNSTLKLEKLTKEDWKKMLDLISREKKFTPIRLFLQSEEFSEYIFESVDWSLFPTPLKKLLHLLSIVKNSGLENDNVIKSTDALHDYLEEHFDFVTEEDVKSIHYTLAALKLKDDLVPLKIFLNHDNLIKYLPLDFRYANYSTPNDAFAAVLDNLLKVPSLKRKVNLYKTMIFVRQFLQGSSRRSFRKEETSGERLSSRDLEFVNALSFSAPKVREFLQPEKLIQLLPESFTFYGRPVFKTKALHLLRQLLKLDTDVQSELEMLLRDVEVYPDVPQITKKDLVPLLNILPAKGIPHVDLIKKYLKPTTLIRLLPGNFDIKQIINAKVALHDLATLLRDTLGSAKSDELQVALDTLLLELKKSNSDVIVQEPIVDHNEIRSIVMEIPFDQYEQIQSLKDKMQTKEVVSSLPLNFQLTGYKTKKLRVLAVLNELSMSDAFQSSLASVDLARNIVDTMPDMPAVNDAEIERLLAPMPLDSVNVRQLIESCKLAPLAPYLPVNFNVSSIESRKTKIAMILQHCKLAYSEDVTTQQALTNAETLLKTSPDFDVTREHVETLMSVIPCTHFTAIVPLLQYLSEEDVAPLLPWDLDVYKTSQTFKQRVLSLLTALRNVKELQNDRIFSALDALETNAKSLPDEVTIPDDYITILQSHQHEDIADTELCKNYSEFVMRKDTLIRILPPTYSFERTFDSTEADWTLIMHFSRLFLREIKMEGPVKNAYEACEARESTYAKDAFSRYIESSTNIAQFVPLRLYVLGGANRAALTAPIDDVGRSYTHGSEDTFARTMVRELIRRPELIGSKSLIHDLENYLQDHMMIYHHDSPPSDHEIDLAISEIPSDRKYSNLRLLMRCQDIRAPIMRRNLMGDGTIKQLLLEMLELAEKGDIDEEVRDSIRILKPNIERGIREEEVEVVFRQMRDYRYHASKVKGIRDYAMQKGMRGVLGNDYRATYHSFKDRLFAFTGALLNDSFPQSNDLRAEAMYLNRVLNNEIKIERTMPRTMDDINVQSLIFALPKTRDERIIRAVIKFLSIPDLLRKLNLPKNPFDYKTKGRLLQAVMDLGQQLESVQEDPVQQEALEYFRSKTTDVGAQPIELKKYARDANVNVDMYGVMRAIDYARVNETDAVEVAMFLGHKYDNLIHAVGFDHMAYATRGAYLKALFEHLSNVSQVPDDVKERIALLSPAVRLDGPGDESVDMNDVAVSAEVPSTFGRRSLDDLEKEKKSLTAAVDNMLQTITSSEEKYLDSLIGQSNIYDDNTRIVIGSSRDMHIAQRMLNLQTIEHPTQNATNGSNLSHGEVKTNQSSSGIGTSNNLTKSMDHVKKNQSTELLLPDEINKIFFKVAKKVKFATLKNDSNWQTNLDRRDSGDNDNSSITSDKHAGESLQVPPKKLSSNKRSKKSRHIPHRTRHKPVRRLLIRPDTSLDIEYDISDSEIPLFRIFHVLQRDKENSSLIKELMSEQTKHINGKQKEKP